jgi:hypothetical protein
MTNTNTFWLISISNLKTGRFETRRFETWRFVNLTFCKRTFWNQTFWNLTFWNPTFCGCTIWSALLTHGLINYTDTKAKFRHRRKLTCKGTLWQAFFCLRQFWRFWIWSDTKCHKLLQNMVPNRTLHSPPPPSHTLSIHIYCALTQEGGRVEPERMFEGQQFIKLGRIYQQQHCKWETGGGGRGGSGRWRVLDGRIGHWRSRFIYF